MGADMSIEKCAGVCINTSADLCVDVCGDTCVDKWHGTMCRPVGIDAYMWSRPVCKVVKGTSGCHRHSANWPKTKMLSLIMIAKMSENWSLSQASLDVSSYCPDQA